MSAVVRTGTPSRRKWYSDFGPRPGESASPLRSLYHRSTSTRPKNSQWPIRKNQQCCTAGVFRRKWYIGPSAVHGLHQSRSDGFRLYPFLLSEVRRNRRDFTTTRSLTCNNSRHHRVPDLRTQKRYSAFRSGTASASTDPLQHLRCTTCRNPPAPLPAVTRPLRSFLPQPADVTSQKQFAILGQHREQTDK